MKHQHSVAGPPGFPRPTSVRRPAGRGPEDSKASSPGNVAFREELAKDGSSAESIEVTIIMMRGMCMGWGVAEIVLSLFGVHVLLKVCRYFIPVEY